MQALLLGIHVILSALLIVLILLQHGRGADAGAAFGSGASATVFGARGSGSFLTKLTAILAIVFFANSLALAYMSARQPKSDSLMGSAVTEIVDESAVAAGTTPDSAAPAQPADLPVTQE
jgi:preprotein translocase subunit SecG